MTASKMSLADVQNANISQQRFEFAKEEEAVLAFWREIDAFKTSLRQSQGRPRYTFYDGPPFATGLPHYGHLLAGTIKVGARIKATFLNDRTRLRVTRTRRVITWSVASVGTVTACP
jgi:hypothetical protein